MPQITFDFELKPEENDLLASILECKKPDGQIDKGAFERVASAIGKAAIEEYLRMILGQKVFTRGKDILEYRMFLLIKAVWITEYPMKKESAICFKRPGLRAEDLLSP